MLEEYIKKLYLGDIDALDNIYEETKKMVYSICLSYMRDRMLAEDMMEETYINIRRYVGNYKNGTDPIAWICTIAKNRCLNEIKSRKRVSYVGDIYDSAIFEETESPISNNTSNQKETPLINIALKILKEKELKVLLFHIVDGKKLIDIAKDMKAPEGTIRWIYNNSLKKIKKYIEKNNIELGGN